MLPTCMQSIHPVQVILTQMLKVRFQPKMKVCPIEVHLICICMGLKQETKEGYPVIQDKCSYRPGATSTP